MNPVLYGNLYNKWTLYGIELLELLSRVKNWNRMHDSQIPTALKLWQKLKTAPIDVFEMQLSILEIAIEEVRAEIG